MQAFGNRCDYAQLVKVFASDLNVGRGRYSSPKMVSSDKEELIGLPDEKTISASFVERQNLTVRMECRRFTRLTNAFSKKLASQGVRCAALRALQPRAGSSNLALYASDGARRRG